MQAKIRNSLLWTFTDKVGVQVIQFSTSIVIARILGPEDFGIVAIVTMFISISSIFIDSGFGKALIQLNNPSQKDLSTVFYVSFFLSVFLYFLLFIFSGYISNFFEIDQLKLIIRVLSFNLIINSFLIIPNVIFSINLDFKPLAVSKLFSSILGSAVGLVLALNGQGLWSIVYMSIASNVMIAFVQWFKLKWVPSRSFSFTSLRKLFKFGSNLLLASTLEVIVSNLSTVYIGKAYNSKVLGLYNRGSTLSNLASNSIISTIYAVLFPAFATIKDEQEKLLLNLKKSIRYISLLVLPLFVLISILSKPLIVLLLTEKWVFSAEILQILIIARMINMIALVNPQVLLALGRSDITMRQDVCKLFLKLMGFFIATQFGVIWIAYSELFAVILSYYVNTYPSGKLYGYGPLSQLYEIWEIILSTVLSMFVGIFVYAHTENLVVKLVVIPIIFLVCYIFLIYFLKQQDLIRFLNRYKSSV